MKEIKKVFKSKKNNLEIKINVNSCLFNIFLSLKLFQ